MTSTRISRENPARPSEVVGTVAVASAADVDVVVQCASAAQRTWATVPVIDRIDALRSAAALVEPHIEAIANLLARESGKPIGDCRGEIGFGLRLVQYYAEVAPRLLADSELNDDGGRLRLERRPYGVVAAITPWNAPVILSLLKVVPALVAGNSVVVKPSPLAPVAVSELLQRLAGGLADGLVTVVHGESETGAALVGHDLVRKVAFTGGLAAARSIGQITAQLATPLVLELGGNDAAILLDDAELDDAAMDRLVMASYATSGQVCMAAKRVYVPRQSMRDFIAAYVAAADRVLVTGDPLLERVTMGPVVTRAAQRRLMSLVEGLPTLRLGSVEGDLGEGYFVRPTVVPDCPDNHPLVADEQFGPVVPVLGYDTVDEVVARANAGDLGLAASVWSADEERAFSVARELESGFVFVNTHNRTGMALRAPFGGVKRSGYGREYGEEGLLEYVQTCATHAPAAFRPGGAGADALSYPST